MMTPTEIMAKLKELDCDACLRVWLNAKNPYWYVDLHNSFLGDFEGNKSEFVYRGNCKDGAEQVLLNFWEFLKNDHANNPDHFILIYAHPDNPIVGKWPQAWVRWHAETNDWIDVDPPEYALKKHYLERDLILSYMDSDIHYQYHDFQ